MTLRRAVVVAPCPFEADPRHGYWSATLRKFGFDVLEIEIVERPKSWRSVSERYQSGDRVSLFSAVPSHSRSVLVEMTRNISCESSTGHYLKGQFLRIFSAIELAVDVIETADLVIANDLVSAVAILNNVKLDDARLIYDAQEVFTDSYDLLAGEPLTDNERFGWRSLESHVVSLVDEVVTVSPGIADLYLRRHGRKPLIIPNYVPQERFQYLKRSSDSKPVEFVFLGRADPHRGLEELIDNWDFDPSVVTLDLYIPNGTGLDELKRRSAGIHREFTGPIFREAVPPHQIVNTLSNYDVGILPYSYPPPYDHASPNKFGEYVAAGLPILANRQPFTAEVIQRLEIGTVFEWNKPGDFRFAVSSSVMEHNIVKWTKNVLETRSTNLCWDVNFEQSLGEKIRGIDSSSINNRKSVTENFQIAGPIHTALLALVRRWMLAIGRRHIYRFRPILGFLARFNLVKRLMS